ncbi:MAG: hypothetical protein JJU08_18420 [Rhodobacteraceae bacterium]|nr:hypothetical protein [Paracoccaceae bacterium]
MNKKLLIAAAMLSGSLVMGTGASAQVDVDFADIETSCSTSGAACTAAIRRAIATLQAAGLPAAQLNAQVAAVTGAAISASQSLPQAQRASISPALVDAASLSTNAAQRASIQTAAAQIQSGSQVTLSPVGQTASPS